MNSLIDWFRRLRGTFYHPPPPPVIDIDLITRQATIRYQEHDDSIALLQDRDRRLKVMNEQWTLGPSTGNVVSDVFRGTWPPRHSRRTVRK